MNMIKNNYLNKLSMNPLSKHNPKLKINNMCYAVTDSDTSGNNLHEVAFLLTKEFICNSSTFILPDNTATKETHEGALDWNMLIFCCTHS